MYDPMNFKKTHYSKLIVFGEIKQPEGRKHKQTSGQTNQLPERFVCNSGNKIKLDLVFNPQLRYSLLY